jgi:diguanylate cyclase (GGDEF)-like protein
VLGTPGPEPSASTLDRGAIRPFDPTARAAVAALARALDVHDPTLGHRAAVRAAVADRVASALALTPDERATVIAGALLADVAALVSHTRPDAETDAASVVLGASVAEEAGTGPAVAAAIRHRLERWDGQGAPHGLRGDAIPRSARIVAVVHLLVGPLEVDGTPHWNARAGRARSLAGTVLDPTIVATVADTLVASPPQGERLDLDTALGTLDALVGGTDQGSPIESLTSVGAAIHAADRIDDVLALIAEHARRALRAARVSIGRIDPAAHAMQVVVNVGELAAGEERFPTDEVVALSTFPPFTAFRTGEAHAITRREAARESAELRYLVERGAQSEIAAPIVVEAGVWGAVWATSRPGRRELDDQDLGTLRLVASQVAAGVAQATRMANLESLALRDPLTGLGNRRVLDAKLRTVFARHAIARQDSAVIICDVDRLKEINDTHGHAAGDAVLLEAADALRLSVVGIADATVCRIGGDEFCIIIDGGGQLLAEPVAERAQRLFARTEERSMSYGVAIATIEMNTPGDLLRAADDAQYRQKRLRRGEAVDVEAEVAAEPPRRRARRDR